MKGDFSIPPLRDLPPGRLAQRREHLLFEITRERESRGALARPWPCGGEARSARLVALAAARWSSSSEPLRRSAACATSSSTGASSACPLRERRLARRRAASSSSVGWGGARPLEDDPSSASGCMPTAESSGAGSGGFPRARTSSPPATSSNDSRRRASSSCGRRSCDSSKAVALHSRLSRPTTIPVGFGVEVRDGDRLVRLREQSEGDEDDRRSNSGSPADRRAAHRPGVGAAVERVGRSRGQGVRAVALRGVHRHRAAEGCVSAPLLTAAAGRGSAPRQEPDKLRGRLLSNIDQVPGHMVVIGRSVTYCSKLATEEAREVAEALSGLDPDPRFHPSSWRIGWLNGQQLRRRRSGRAVPPPRPGHLLRLRVSVRDVTGATLQNGEPRIGTSCSRARWGSHP